MLNPTLPLLLLLAACSSGLQFGGGSSPVPRTQAAVTQQAVRAVQAAIKSGPSPGGLIEVEFPASQQLSKAESKEAEDVNVDFAKSLIDALSVPFIGAGPCRLVLPTSASRRLKSSCNAKRVRSVDSSDAIQIFLCPSSPREYADAADRSALSPTIIINGLAKNPKSVSDAALNAFYLKPLTYNSCVVGFLYRCYPRPWLAVDDTSAVLREFEDRDIRVKGTSTPDLREAVKLCSKAWDDRAIAARRK
mmetsp:Transcript_19709/g.39404  ORF Transcript_19709/g.39404 Transcript_19709/m.39404 type:complete len:248 (-) Transcript_19709:37-780(-)